MRNVQLAKNSAPISTSQNRTLPQVSLSNLNIKKTLLVNNKIRIVVPNTSVAPEKILVSKKIVNSFDHFEIDPLQTSIKLETPPDDEILEE